MACMLRSATNAQVCNLAFMVSYLVKYVAGKEIRKSPHFKSGKHKDEVIADRGIGAAPNEKISGVKMHQDKLRNKKGFHLFLIEMFFMEEQLQKINHI